MRIHCIFLLLLLAGCKGQEAAPVAPVRAQYSALPEQPLLPLQYVLLSKRKATPDMPYYEVNMWVAPGTDKPELRRIFARAIQRYPLDADYVALWEDSTAYHRFVRQEAALFQRERTGRALKALPEDFKAVEQIRQRNTAAIGSTVDMDTFVVSYQHTFSNEALSHKYLMSLK